MTADTPPDVGTIMKWGDFEAEVLVSSPGHLVARDEHGWLLALRQADGGWLDNEGDRWEVVTAMTADTPPPVGTTMRCGELRAEVLLSSNEYLVGLDGNGWLHALRYLDGAWHGNVAGLWEIATPEVQP